MDRIADAAQISEADAVLEIGPGIGTLTQRLAERAGKVLAVEIDRGLIPILAESLAEYDNVEVIQGDILEQNLNDLSERLGGKRIKGGRKSPLLHHNADFDEASGERTSD